MPINTQPETVGILTGITDGDIIYIALNSGGNMQTMSVQAEGTWDGGDLVYQISNDNTNWYDAYDGANLLALSADGIMIVQTQGVAIAYLYARLIVRNGSGSVDLTVTVAGGRG